MRYLSEVIDKDLKKKMVFLGGPRQVGKTTLAKESLARHGLDLASCYLNWDFKAHRKQLLSEELPHDQEMLVLDEIHKFRRWRALVKGFYDVYGATTKVLVTGSARLDYYRKGGDSLQGRYHYYRLHPFSWPEIKKLNKAISLENLFVRGGFPEPLFAEIEDDRHRWQRERTSRIVEADIRELENIRELSLVELLIEALPERVGVPLSINNLREDLEVNHQTASRWLDILERIYHCFRLMPFGSTKMRAVKKEKKLYLWDWSVINDPGYRFENMIACLLLKYCHFLEDTKGVRMELKYLRDSAGREVDFVVIRDRKPLFAVEAKLSKGSPSDHMRYFRERTSIPRFYQVCLEEGFTPFGDPDKSGKVLAMDDFCTELNLI